MSTDSGILDDDSQIAGKVEFVGDASPHVGDSELLSVRPPSDRLKIYEVGQVTVVGFGGHDVPSEYCIAESRDLLARLIRENDCEELIFDLTGVRMIPSGMLGVLASMRNLCATVSVCNPSPDIREVLATTQLDKIIHIREVEV